MFKRNFIKLCNQRGVAPSAVCRQVGIAPATFSCWTDESVPRQATLMRIADYFGVTVDDLLSKEEPLQKETPATEGDEQLMEAWRLFTRLDAEAQAQALKYLAFLADSSNKQ